MISTGTVKMDLRRTSSQSRMNSAKSVISSHSKLEFWANLPLVNLSSQNNLQNISMFHISTKSKFCKTFKNGMPKSKENTSTPKQKKKDSSNQLQTARPKNSELSKKNSIELPEKKKRQNKNVVKRWVMIIDQMKKHLQHKKMETKKILVTVLHLQRLLLKMQNQTRKMQTQMKYLKLINFIKSSWLSLKLMNKTQKTSLSLWILSQRSTNSKKRIQPRKRFLQDCCLVLLDGG